MDWYSYFRRIVTLAIAAQLLLHGFFGCAWHAAASLETQPVAGIARDAHKTLGSVPPGRTCQRHNHGQRHQHGRGKCRESQGTATKLAHGSRPVSSGQGQPCSDCPCKKTVCQCAVFVSARSSWHDWPTTDAILGPGLVCPIARVAATRGAASPLGQADSIEWLPMRRHLFHGVLLI